MTRFWKTDEIRIILDGLEAGLSVSEIAKQLPHRSPDAVRVRAASLLQENEPALQKCHVRDWLFGQPEDSPSAMHESIAEIVARVAAEAGVSSSAIFSQSRLRAHVRARHAAMYLAYRETGKSLPKIGLAFGNRDHTTVLHAIRKVEAAPHLYPIGTPNE